MTTTMTTATLTKNLFDPATAAPSDFRMPDDIRNLRDACLELHALPKGSLPEVLLADAAAWGQHGEGEPWILWKARKFASRLAALNVPLDAGESVIGKPALVRDPLPPAQEQAAERARKALESMPPHPGGDNGHFHPDYERLFARGLGGILSDIDAHDRAPDLTAEQRDFYQACRLTMTAFSSFIQRVAQECREAAVTTPEAAEHWSGISDICARIAGAPPATFHEAIQLMNFTLFVAWFAEDHGQSNYGRMDQTLRPFYERDLAAGRITPQAAFELICCLFIQQNRMHWPGGAVAVIVGGIDNTGRDVTNDLTYLCLAARLATKLVYPTVAIAWHDRTPGELMRFAVKMLATGVGDPAFFNDPVISAGLKAHGASEADSHNFMNSTCVEIKVAGASNIWVATPYINCPGAMLEVMDAEANGAATPSDGFDEFLTRVEHRLASKIRAAAERNEHVWQERTRTGCQPFGSCLTKDCLARGRDMDRGGARYHWVENSWVGLANLVDSLTVIRRLVYQTGELTLAELYHICASDFQNHDALRERIRNSFPKYGTDTPDADALAREVAQSLMDTTESNTVGGHRYVPGFFCWIQHERLGSQTMATPDGRPAGFPLADGAGPAQGRERKGPSAAILSTTCWPHEQALGGLVHNVKFTRDFLANPANHAALLPVIETYLRRGGFEIQVNVVDNADLRDAQTHPENYQDLLVRVAGYSDYFVHLNPNMQEEIIQRSAFTAL